MRTSGNRRSTSREIKRQLKDLLSADSRQNSLAAIGRLSGKRAIGPLLSFFHSRSEIRRWRAVTATGVVVDRMARSHPEDARVIMRRLMWYLNDESGGIGWGVPEAMGEILAVNGQLAREYAGIFVCYLDPTACYLEHTLLQRGVLWGMGRLAHARPEHAGRGGSLILPFLTSPDPVHRAFSAWAAGAVGPPEIRPLLERLLGDTTPVHHYRGWEMTETTVAALAREALSHHHAP